MDFLPSDLIFQQQQPNNHENTHHHLHFPPQLHSLKRSVSCEHEEVNTVFNGGEDELSDDGYSQIVGGGGEKKRRLNVEQVRALERSFELGNKLEPERKLELAKALGLQPRQIAIWFQNRRARWKTKQLEKDYDLLKKQFDAVKADNDALQSHNQRLHAQLEALKNGEPTGAAPVNPKREAEDCWSYGTEGNSDAIDMSRAAAATNGMVSPHQFSEKPLFPTTSLRPSITQLLHGSSEATADTIRCPKGMDQMAQDDSLICNMLGGVEDRPGFWPWHEQHHFN